MESSKNLSHGKIDKIERLLIEGASVKEVSRIMGIKANTIYRHVHRKLGGIHKVKAMIAQKGKLSDEIRKGVDNPIAAEALSDSILVDQLENEEFEIPSNPEEKYEYLLSHILKKLEMNKNDIEGLDKLSKLWVRVSESYTDYKLKKKELDNLESQAGTREIIFNIKQV